MEKKPLYFKIWKGQKNIPHYTEGVRAHIESRDNFSILVSCFRSEEFMQDAPETKPLETPLIEIQLPCGLMWSGTINDLQTALKPHSR